MRDTDQDKSVSPEPNKRKSRSSSRSSAASKKSDLSRSSYSKSRSRSRSRSSEIDGYRLHIADIGEDCRKSDLDKVFAPYGELKEVWMTNSTPCFGFAVFKSKKAASQALRATDGIEVGGCRIRVSYARPRTRGSGRRFFNTNMRCYQCGYSGHFYRDCPEINGDKRDSRYNDGGGYDRRSRGHRDRDHYGRDHGRSRYGGGGGGGGGGDYGGRSRRRSGGYDDHRSGGGGGRSGGRSSGRRHY